MFMASSSITRTVGLCSSILRSVDGVKLGAIMKQFESSKSSTLSMSTSVLGLGAANVIKDPSISLFTRFSSQAGLVLSLKVTKPS